jgi:hypothetical protein
MDDSRLFWVHIRALKTAVLAKTEQPGVLDWSITLKALHGVAPWYVSAAL